MHALKCWPAPFTAVLAGFKAYEIRDNDRDYRVGDVLRLCEWSPADDTITPGHYPVRHGAYTGRECTRVVTHMTPGGEWGLPEHLCVLSLAPPTPTPAVADALRGAWDFAAVHPDPQIAREVVIDTLLGALHEATGGLTRALDVRCATPEGLAVKADVRHALANAQKALARAEAAEGEWGAEIESSNVPEVDAGFAETRTTILALAQDVRALARQVASHERTIAGLGATAMRAMEQRDAARARLAAAERARDEAERSEDALARHLARVAEAVGVDPDSYNGEPPSDFIIAALRARGEPAVVVDALADCVVKATEYGTQEGGFVATYILPTGPIHRAIPLLSGLGVEVRPGFDGRATRAAPMRDNTEELSMERDDYRRAIVAMVQAGGPIPDDVADIVERAVDEHASRVYVSARVGEWLRRTAPSRAACTCSATPPTMPTCRAMDDHLPWCAALPARPSTPAAEGEPNA